MSHSSWLCAEASTPDNPHSEGQTMDCLSNSSLVYSQPKLNNITENCSQNSRLTRQQTRDNNCYTYQLLKPFMFHPGNALSQVTKK